MNDNQTTQTIPNPTTPQVVDALLALEPSVARDTAVRLLESGAINADSTIGDLARALDSYYAAASPAQQ